MLRLALPAAVRDIRRQGLELIAEVREGHEAACEDEFTPAEGVAVEDRLMR